MNKIRFMPGDILQHFFGSMRLRIGIGVLAVGQGHDTDILSLFEYQVDPA